MAKAFPIVEFLDKAAVIPVIDVRSEGEFSQGHIPGAINVPLFSNSERAVVGTIYKQQSKELAVQKGLEIVGPKLASFVQEVKSKIEGKEVLVHCWRGGMRSGSFAWLLETSGLSSSTLTKGYKAYRAHVQSVFDQPLQLVLLGGKTGSGKTKILQHLQKYGEQVIDLEALCSHKGSAFGAIGQERQCSTEQFENNLCALLQTLDTSKRIWIEDESRNLGAIFLPEKFWQQMKAAPLIFLEVEIDLRIKNLVQDYASFPKDLLEESILRIHKRLGGLQLNQAIEALANNDFERVAEICLFYYDKAYLNSLSKRNVESTTTIAINKFDLDTITKLIVAKIPHGKGN
jgi:tRNA 2-selenouridine synthase